MQRESWRTPAATRIILWAVIELALGFVSAHAMPPLWIEAEDYAAQEGSRAPRFLMPTASGGACVDNDWGGGSKHFLRYDVELADDAAQLFVTQLRQVETALQVREQRAVGRMNLKGKGKTRKATSRKPRTRPAATRRRAKATTRR